MLVLEDGLECDDCDNEDEGRDKREGRYGNESMDCNCMQKRPGYGYYSSGLR